jgi:hypothetical protein
MDFRHCVIIVLHFSRISEGISFIIFLQSASLMLLIISPIMFIIVSGFMSFIIMGIIRVIISVFSSSVMLSMNSFIIFCLSSLLMFLMKCLIIDSNVRHLLKTNGLSWIKRFSLVRKESNDAMLASWLLEENVGAVIGCYEDVVVYLTSFISSIMLLTSMALVPVTIRESVGFASYPNVSMVSP